MAMSFSLLGAAQTQTPAAPSSSGPQGDQTQQVPDSGGPQGDIGPVAVPKKKSEEEKPAPKPPVFKNPEGMPDYSIHVNVPVVTVDVSVLTKAGGFVPGLKKDNFRVLEDGVPQQVQDVQQTGDAPITAVLLTEFAATNYPFINDMLAGAYSFAQTLRPKDWVAVVSYDIKPTLEVDFTQDKRAVFAALNHMRVPLFRETNLFDALYDTLDRLDGVHGRKYIILITSGVDSFSKINYDKILQKVKDSRNTVIYCVGTGQAYRIYLEAATTSDPFGDNMQYLQADNELNTFANMTGGRAYFPRFQQDMPDIFADIGNAIRNQYLISYKPSNTKQDGSWRKLKIELVAPDGGPLKMVNEKGKAVKYQVIARDGYRAKNQVE